MQPETDSPTRREQVYMRDAPRMLAGVGEIHQAKVGGFELLRVFISLCYSLTPSRLVQLIGGGVITISLILYPRLTFLPEPPPPRSTFIIFI